MKKTKLPINTILEVLARVILTLFYYNLARNHLHIFFQYHKISSLLYVLTESILLAFVIFRISPQRFSASPFDWLIAMLATLAPLLVIPIGNTDNFLILLGQCLGLIITIAGIFSLNRSFGIIPAERKIKTGGMYKFIRHPLYAGYIISNIAILLNNYNPRNLACVIIATILQLIRIIREENFLCQNAEYQQLMQSTKWRLVPFIW